MEGLGSPVYFLTPRREVLPDISCTTLGCLHAYCMCSYCHQLLVTLRFMSLKPQMARTYHVRRHLDLSSLVTSDTDILLCVCMCGCELSSKYRCWDTNSGPLGEQHLLLTPEPPPAAQKRTRVYYLCAHVQDCL